MMLSEKTQLFWLVHDTVRVLNYDGSVFIYVDFIQA
jgi:hypothetical protein